MGCIRRQRFRGVSAVRGTGSALSPLTNSHPPTLSAHSLFTLEVLQEGCDAVGVAPGAQQGIRGCVEALHQVGGQGVLGA